MRLRATSLAFAAAALIGNPGTAHAATPPKPVIDMHLHALHADSQGPPPALFCQPSPTNVTWDPALTTDAAARAAYKKANCAAPIWSPATDDALRNASLAELRKYNITGVASGSPAVVQAWAVAEPSRIIPAVTMGDEPYPSIEQLRALYKAGRLKVLGEISVQYDGVGPNDPRLEPYFALAEELDIPVGIHMGPGPRGASYMPGFNAYRARLSDPLQLEDVLVRHPYLRLYVMHAGWPMADNMIALLFAHPQVYVDTAVIDFILPPEAFHSYLRRLVEAGFEKRIMFGSDQMVWPQAIAIGIQSIQSATFLTEAQKRDILHDNAARFLRLEPGETSFTGEAGRIPAAPDKGR